MRTYHDRIVDRQQAGALSRKDAAAYCGGISTRQLDKWAAAGLIQRCKLGSRTVYLRAELDRFLQSRLQRVKGNDE
jgi:hypothetical protein